MDEKKTGICEIPRNFLNSAKNAGFRDFRGIAENRPSRRHQTLSCTITIMCITEMNGYQPFCLWSRLTHRLQRDYASQADTGSYLPWSQWLKWRGAGSGGSAPCSHFPNASQVHSSWYSRTRWATRWAGLYWQLFTLVRHFPVLHFQRFSMYLFSNVFISKFIKTWPIFLLWRRK